jgi:hypothetical protein
MKNKSEEKPSSQILCPICGVKLRDDDRLKKHLKNVHKSGSPKKRGHLKKPRMGGKTYAITICPFCQAEIYKRHLRKHVDEFHPDQLAATPPTRQSQVILDSKSKVSLEWQEDQKGKFIVDEDGFLRNYQDWIKNSKASDDSANEKNRSEN